MAMTSYTERRLRRGGITELEFIGRLTRAGFVECEPRAGFLHEFTHPDTPEEARYGMTAREGYALAADRLIGELVWARRAVVRHG